MSAPFRLEHEMTARRLARAVTLPPPAPGFAGAGHTAVHAITPEDFAQSDPFILLADDRLDRPSGGPVGGPHPHAGFEIVTFLVEGELRERDEGTLRAGDVVWTTTGSGVVHGEDIEAIGRTRVLQLWVTSPSATRWVEPRAVRLAREDAAVRRAAGVEARVYSGVSGTVDGGSYLNLPLTFVDVRLQPGAVFEQKLPASYNGFVYVLEGQLTDDGPSHHDVSAGQLAWLEHGDAHSPAVLRLTAGADGARAVLYAGERQNVPIVTKGPFVGETREDLFRVSRDWALGRMPRLSELGQKAAGAGA